MFLRLIFSPLLLPVIIFAAGFVYFKESTPVCSAMPLDAQIFVLTGDARRIPFALRKLENHPKRKLYVIGAGTPTIETKFQDQIKVENDSKTTYENALAIRKIVRVNGFKRITVITTVDHMNRAVYLIEKEIPNVSVNPCSVPLNKMPAPVRLERWMQEYVKFIGTIFGIQEKAA